MPELAGGDRRRQRPGDAAVGLSIGGALAAAPLDAVRLAVWLSGAAVAWTRAADARR